MRFRCPASAWRYPEFLRSRQAISAIAGRDDEQEYMARYENCGGVCGRRDVVRRCRASRRPSPRGDARAL
jgi:hypothetical protein